MFHRLRQFVERYFLYHLIRLFRIRGKSEEVARGFSIGLVVNFFPTFGFGVLISPAVARLFGGHVIAGLAGGALLTFFWPFLFYLNMRMGSLFVRPTIVIDEFEDVTEKSISALQWGGAFMAGAILNSILVGGMSYLILRLIYRRIRPAALALFRDHAGQQRRQKSGSAEPDPASGESEPNPEASGKDQDHAAPPRTGTGSGNTVASGKT